ncbi:MAG: hypothetical protein OXH76_09290 [Boseongicola sp.]|nr:hypothetical protein [Boseongicola sp.]MXY15581.1 hypothetical protein [Acidobacteriota bacterium]MYE10505.1 hypothetical protein [Gammaproteobacteria bacterium]
MIVTREELQEAGASPELARILADELSRGAPGDLARNPMFVTLSGIAAAAFLITVAFLVAGVTGVRTETAVLDARTSGLEVRMAGIEDRPDRLLQE